MKKNLIGAQVGAISFVDEGVDHVLDFLQKEAGVNSIFISALSWARGNAGRATMGYPDHGPQEADNLQGGAFFKPDSKYYGATFLKDFEAPDPLCKGFDILRDVIPAAKKRGMDTYIYYCETSRPDPKSRWIPGWVHVLEVDHLGRRGKIPCYNNPQYVSWWRCVMEDYCNNHDLTGLMWGLERKSALLAVLDGESATCFCEHCMEKAHKKNIDGERAKEGYAKLYQYVKDCKNNVEMPDGYLATFVRTIFQYPEILQWEKMWYESHVGLAKEIYGVGKWLSPEKHFGLGVWQITETFSFWLRAQYQYADFKECADFIKPILYNIPAGPRFKDHVLNRQKNVFKDYESAALLTQALYPALGLKQPPFEKLDQEGFSTEYIQNAIKRIRKGVDDTMPVFAGIPSGVPTGPGKVESQPNDIIAAVKATFECGGKGVVLSRNFSEANLDNMRACKTAIDQMGLDVTSERTDADGKESSVY